MWGPPKVSSVVSRQLATRYLEFWRKFCALFQNRREYVIPGRIWSKQFKYPRWGGDFWIDNSPCECMSHSRSELNIPNIHSLLVIVTFHYCVVILLLLPLRFPSSPSSSLSQNLSSLVHKIDVAFTPDCCSPRPCENIELRQIAIDPLTGTFFCSFSLFFFFWKSVKDQLTFHACGE